jgi:GxxExxY protein
MMKKLERDGIPAVSQSAIKVICEDEIIGEHFADILVDNKIIVEVKVSKSLTNENEAPLLNYLQATEVEVELLLNSGPTPDLKRKVFDNIRKYLSVFICANPCPI